MKNMIILWIALTWWHFCSRSCIRSTTHSHILFFFTIIYKLCAVQCAVSSIAGRGHAIATEQVSSKMNGTYRNMVVFSFIVQTHCAR